MTDHPPHPICLPMQLGPIVLAMIVMLSLILITGAAIKDLIVRGG